MLAEDHLKQIGNPAVPFDRMTEVLIAVNAVAVPPSVPASFEYAGMLEVLNYVLNGAFGDAYPVRDITKPRIRILREMEQHVRVVRQECPVTASGLSRFASNAGLIDVADAFIYSA